MLLPVIFGATQAQAPAILTMQGDTWILRVDSAKSTDLQAVTATEKSSSEKELTCYLKDLATCEKLGAVEFYVSTTGLTAYKQLPLTEEEIKQGAVRPENVVNSFACFDSSGRKVLHIYASQLVDAKGNKIWCDSNLEKGVLSVVLPLEWLKSAVFPVLLDPTFGYSSVGASSDNGRNNYVLGTLFECPGNGTVVSMSLYATSVAGSGRVAIYSDSAGAPSGAPSESTSDVLSEGWTNFTVSKSVVDGDFYWLCFQVSSNFPVLYWDTGADNSYLYKTFSYDAFPNPLVPDGYYNKKFSVYATYEVEEEPTPSPTAAPSATVLSLASLSLDLNNTYAILLLILAFIVLGIILIYRRKT